MRSRQGFITQIQNCQALINKILFLYADNAEDRKDLRQEILVQAWRSFKTYRKEATFSTWIYRIGLNVAISSLRRKKRKAQYPPEQPQVPASDKELLELIMAVLNEVEKSVVLLLIEGYRNEEISEILGISNQNVRVKIHRIRKKLNAYGITDFAG